MSFTRRVSFIAPLVLLALQSPLLAADFRFLAWDDAVGIRKLGLQSGTEVQEIKDLHPLKRTPTVKGKGQVQQLVALDKLDATGKPHAVALTVPADFQSPLVLVMPDPKHPTGVRPFVIDDNTARFKWGSIRVLNATGKVALMKVENTGSQLPAAWTPVDIDPGGAKRNMAVQVALKDDPKTIVYSAVWEHDPDVRELVILIPDPESRMGTLDCKIIPENRKALEAAAAAAAKDE